MRPGRASALAATVVTLCAFRATAAQRPFKLARCAASGQPAQLGWRVRNHTIDGLAASVLVGAGVRGSVGSAFNCPGGSDCHSWGLSFTDRNGVFKLQVALAGAGAFTLHSWPASPSMPVQPGNAPPGQCVTAGHDGWELYQRPASPDCLQLRLSEQGGQLHVVGPTPVAGRCLDAHPANWKPPPPPHPSPPPPSPPNLASAARLAPCAASSIPAVASVVDARQRWQLSGGALRLSGTQNCLDFGTANGQHPQIQACVVGARSQAVQTLVGTESTLLLAASGFNMSVRQGNAPQSLPNVSALCLAADRSFVALVSCGSLSRYQRWTHAAPNGTLTVASSGLCLTAGLPVHIGTPVVVTVGAASAPPGPVLCRHDEAVAHWPLVEDGSWERSRCADAARRLARAHGHGASCRRLPVRALPWGLHGRYDQCKAKFQ